MTNLEFHLFNYGAYPNVPWSYDREKSLYIDLPTTHFDPLRGKKALNSYFDTLILGEELGFDAIHSTTQMGGPIGITPTANLAAAYLIAKTSRIHIGTLGPILNAYSSPVRAAEEVALLDLMSGGRLIVGLPMGHGQNYHTAATMNPASARERYWEAHDLFVKALATDEPFEWQGKHFHVPHVNVWPKPIQSPRPRIWIPAAGSKITLEKAAEHRYTYQALFSPKKSLEKNIRLFKEAAETFGYTPGPDQIAQVVFIHVAETDAQARLEAEPHLLWLFQNLNRSLQHDAFPPGHFSVDSMRAALTGGGYRDRDIGKMTFDELIEQGWAIVGSPATVREKLEEGAVALGAGTVVHVADMGAMPNWMVRKSITMMAEEVIPHFRDPDGLPVWAKENLPGATATAYGATVKPPLEVPQVDLPDVGIVDASTAHISDLRVALPRP